MPSRRIRAGQGRAGEVEPIPIPANWHADIAEWEARDDEAAAERCRVERDWVLTELTGLTFDEAWRAREAGRFGELTVDFIGREAFIRNKRATGRTKDLGDIEGL